MGLYNLLAKLCFVIFAIVAAVMFAAILRFRRRSDDEQPEQIHGNTRIELGLLIAATLVQIFVGIKTIDVMWYVEEVPEDTTMTIYAIGFQWDWQFRYPDGTITDDLVVPAHQNIQLEITSKDVIHSLFIPELGVKMDAVPGRFNRWWFNADGPLNQVVGRDPMPRELARRQESSENYLPTTRHGGPMLRLLNELNFFEKTMSPEQTQGLEKRVEYLAVSRQPDSRYAKYDAVEYRGMCTEICGRDHYNMYFRVVAMTASSFKQWQEDVKSGVGQEVNGETLYNGKCASCHQNNGSGVEGQFPPLAGAEWVNEDTKENKERHINVVLQGLKGEIQVKGVTYNGVMQPWFNVLNDDEVAAVVNHERLSWGNNGGTVDAKMVADLRKAAGYPAFAAGGSTPLAEDVLLKRGKDIYAACVNCHGEDGAALRPALGKSTKVLADTKGYIDMLIHGTAKKSPWARR